MSTGAAWVSEGRVRERRRAYPLINFELSGGAGEPHSAPAAAARSDARLLGLFTGAGRDLVQGAYAAIVSDSAPADRATSGRGSSAVSRGAKENRTRVLGVRVSGVRNGARWPAGLPTSSTHTGGTPYRSQQRQVLTPDTRTPKPRRRASQPAMTQSSARPTQHECRTTPRAKALASQRGKRGEERAVVMTTSRDRGEAGRADRCSLRERIEGPGRHAGTRTSHTLQ